MGIFSGFKSFISQGNVMDMAVGVIIGGAFGAIINSLVADVLTPVLGLIFGIPDFSKWVIAESIKIGSFINAIIAFLMIAFALYFFVIVPLNAMKRKEAEAPAAPPAPSAEEQLLAEIRDLLKAQR